MSTDDQALAQIREALARPDAAAGQVLQDITRVLLRHQYAWVSRWLANACRMQVRGGPLAGLRYVPASSGSVFPPKLVGCYEAELHPMLAKILATPYTRLVDVGCAEGYYAVGLARAMPGLEVFAFDLDPTARSLCQQMAALNDVTDRVHVGDRCDAAELRRLCEPGTVVICDIEGAEVDLLDPAAVPELAGVDVLVECHDFQGRPISAELAARFAATHRVEVIANAWTNPNAWDLLVPLRPIHKFLAVWEGRPGLTPWLWLTTPG